MGLGFGRAVHLPAFRLLAPLGVEVVALCSTDEARSRTAAATAGVPAAYGDWRRLVDDPGVDLVVVATPPAAHAAPALATIAAGKALLCEKPLAATLPEAEQIAAAAAAPGVVAAVSFGYRTLPAIAAARRLLESGELGAGESLDIDWRLGTRRALPPGTPPSWKDDALSGGGALHSHGVHMLDLAVLLLGPVTRVRAKLEGRASAAGRSDDACTIHLEHAAGGQTRIAVTLVAQDSHGHHITLSGSHGRVILASAPGEHVRGFGARLERPGEAPRLLDPGPPEWSAPAGLDGRVEPVAATAAALLGELRGGPRTAPAIADGLVAQRLLEAVAASSETGGWKAP